MLSKVEADAQISALREAASIRDFQDAVLLYGPELGSLYQAAVETAGLPPEEISHRREAFLAGCWNALRTSFITDDQEAGVKALQALTAINAVEITALKARNKQLSQEIMFLDFEHKPSV